MMSLTQCPSDDPHICPHCQQIVPKVEMTVLGKVKYIQPHCKCEVNKYESEMQEMEDRKREREIQSKFAISSLGDRFAKCTFEAFEIAEENKRSYDLCKTYAEEFEGGSEAPMLWGQYGNGKSHLAAATAHTLVKRGFIVVFQTVPELLERIRSTFNGRNKETEQDVMYALLNCNLLILDDIGSEKVTDWVQDVLFRIVDGRYRKERPIMYTTNLKPSELKDKVGPRIYDRMIETSILVQNTATSHRMKIAERRFKQEGA